MPFNISALTLFLFSDEAAGNPGTAQQQRDYGSQGGDAVDSGGGLGSVQSVSHIFEGLSE